MQEYQIEETVKLLALPVGFFKLIKFFRFGKTSLKGAQNNLEFVAGYTGQFRFESNVLGDDIGRFLYDYDVQEKPIYENEENYW